MVKKQTKIMGYPVEYNVPETSAEFNALDPSRPDAAVDEANNNIVYRSMNPDTRFFFLHGVNEEAAKEYAERGVTLPSWAGLEEDTSIERERKPALNSKGEPRKNSDGEPIMKFVESEEDYSDRVIAELVKTQKFASEDAVRAHYGPIIAGIAAVIPFDPKMRERKERAPVKLAQKYKVTAAVLITRGTQDAFLANQLAKARNGETPTWTASGDTSKMFTGTATLPLKPGQTEAAQVQYNVSDKDAESLGRLVKEFADWNAQQAMNSVAV